MPVRLGLLGCGEHSEIGHATPLARYSAAHPGAISLVAACDLRRDRAELFCKQYGFSRAYHDLSDMLANEELDICIAVVPVEHISEIGIKLLETKTPCVVEKPLGKSLEEVKRLRDVARATKTKNMVSVNRRFMPLLNRAMEWSINAGALCYVRATMIRHARTESDFLRSTAIHAVDTMRYIAGNVSSAEIHTLNATPAYWYAIDLSFAKGVRGRIDVLPTAGLLEETYELVGEGFCAVVTSPFGPQRSLRCYRENQLTLEETPGNDTPEDVIHGFHGEVTELVEAFTHNRSPKPSIEDVFPSVELCFGLANRVGLE